METTPSSSTRRVTRSQTLAAATTTNNNVPISGRNEDSEKGGSKSRQRATKPQQDRSALIDITNDSPIVGVATGGLLETPSSAMSKRRTIRAKNNTNNTTPGSGETLLRCQVKTLLQKVEEEAELSKISLQSRPFIQLLAPTPANTPQVLNLSEDAGVAANKGLASTDASPVIQEQMISQVASDIFDGKILESIESGMDLISRSLLLDFSERTESTECSSVVTDFSKGEESNPDEEDGSSSVWSIQVNASSVHDEDDEELSAEEEVDESYDDKHEENNEAKECNNGGLVVDELCEEMSKISVNGNEQKMTRFTGKHTRFLYNSDDEIVEETASGASPNALCLKGLPTPKGKHIRFDI